jgi:phosphohistidine phosphatase
MMYSFICEIAYAEYRLSLPVREHPEMKTLRLLRHAKSSWDDPGLGDRERGLNARGLRDAPRMGAALGARLQPVTVWVSPARRARMTLSGLVEGWPALQTCEQVVEEALYTFSAQALCRWIAAQADAIDPLFLIGHNPAMTNAANWLLDEARFDNIPTAGFVELHMAITHWTELDEGCAMLGDSIFPKQLR